MCNSVCLVVDDEEVIRKYLRAILERESILALEAENASQAMRIVQDLGGRLDLLITDIRMPGAMDGCDLAYAVRRSYPAVPVILISGYFDEASLRNADAGFLFLPKPFSAETVLSAARRVLARKSEVSAGEA